MRPRRRIVGATMLSCAAVAAMTLAYAAPASAAAGDPTITLPINDSAAGGTYDQDFTRVYANTTPDGTPVYIYVPEGTPLDGSAPTGIDSLDPAFDHNPGDDFTPCADADVADFTLTQAEIDYMGDQLASHVVAIDEEHFGAMLAADPSDPSSDSLVMVVYNVQDDAYYDCAETSYTAGYFAPDFIDSNGMNVIVVDALDWANRVGPNDSPWRDDDPSNDRPTLYEGVIAHELQHLLHNYSDPGELSWVDEGLADFAIFLNGYEVGGSHLTYHQVFYAETSLNNWTVQIIAACDLTPGVNSPFEITDGAGNYVYRLAGDLISQGGFNTKCANGTKKDFATMVSNLPTGDLTFLDAGYKLSVTNTKK